MSIGTDALIQYQNLAVAPPTAQKATKGQVNERLLTACQDFEAVFIKQMLDAMRNTVPKSGFLSGGIAQGIYKDMLYQQYADRMAKTAHFGLGRLLYNQLSGRNLDAVVRPGV